MSRQEPLVLSRLLPHAPVALVTLVMFFLSDQFFFSHVEGDQAFLLYAAQRVLASVQLDGPQLIETNPPFIIWFNLIPAGLTHVLYVDPVLMLRLITLVIVLCSAVWVYRVLTRAGVQKDLGAGSARLLWIFMGVVMVQPAEFGQREQLLLALILPCLLAVSLDLTSKLSLGECITMGAAAGLAVCFKPHHVLTIVALELFVLLYRRSLRHLISPELITSIVTCGLYVVAVRLLVPSYMQMVVPLLNSTYWGLGEFSILQDFFRLHIPATFRRTPPLGTGGYGCTRCPAKCGCQGESSQAGCCSESDPGAYAFACGHPVYGFTVAMSY